MPGAIYIAGPTASGKSAVALLVAERLGGEIVSVDSMQVYRGMDIGTAKPTASERARIPHHLIDLVEPSEPFDAARFLTLARAAEREILGRSKIPIFCGGTGLYFNALVYGVGTAPAPDAVLRAEIEATPLPKLLEELERSDPQALLKIDRANPRRVMRAVEVIRTTGKPFSEQRSTWQKQSQREGENATPAGCWFGLERERSDLVRRIEERVDAMFAAGLVEETKALLERGLEQNRTAMQAIGYRQVVEHLRGERNLAATIELVKQKTRQYAKRQMTWFRGQLKLNWIPVSVESDLSDIADKVVAAVQGKKGTV